MFIYKKKTIIKSKWRNERNQVSYTIMVGLNYYGLIVDHRIPEFKDTVANTHKKIGFFENSNVRIKK